MNNNFAAIERAVRKRGGTAVNFNTIYAMADDIMEVAKQTIPVDTRNLMEGTGIGIYYNGVLRSFRQDDIATVPKTIRGQEVWGRKTLAQALSIGASKYSSGLWIVLFSTMPYAKYVNWRTDFFEKLSSTLFSKVGSQFKIQSYYEQIPSV